MPRVRVEPTQAELSKLGSMTIVKAAKAFNRSRDTISRWRKQYLPNQPVKRGRPTRQLPAALAASLGAAADYALARQYKIPKNTIRNQRVASQIPPHRPARRRRPEPVDA